MTRNSNLLETIKAIILDTQATSQQTGVPRRVRMTMVHGKAAVCIGVRRSGKSTFLFLVIGRLLADGVPRENILYLNFFDDRLHPLRHEGLGAITEANFSVYPEKKNVETVHCFFDEIQAVPDWEPFIDRLMRTEKCQIYLSGSSARMLSKEIATQMRGRAYPEIFSYRTKTGREVDFVIVRRGRSGLLVQVCETLADPKTKKREMAAIAEAMAELRLDSGTLVTRNEGERIAVPGGSVEVVPIWRFLLELPDAQA